MIGTLFSLAIAIGLYFFPIKDEVIKNTPYLGLLLFAIATLFIIAQIAITVFAWAPLLKAEHKLTPNVMKTFQSDRNLKLTNLFLLCFLFFTYLFVIDIWLLNIFNKFTLLILWTIFLGVAVDVLNHDLKRIMKFLTPSYVVETYGDSAMRCIQLTNEEELCEWIDVISETAIKSLSQNGTSLSLSAIDKLRLMTKNYLQVAKGITYHAEDQNSKFGGSDHVSFTLFYLFQRLELIFNKAIEQKLEPVCSYIMTTLGKICYYGAKYDITLAAYPLHYFRKFADKSHMADLNEVGNRATVTLLEVSKLIIKEVDLKYCEIKEFFFAVIGSMHELTRNTFRQDKTQNITVLTQPFYELKKLFSEGTLAEHQDSPEILKSINMVLDEFASLEAVMQTMPSMPPIEKENLEKPPVSSSENTT